MNEIFLRFAFDKKETEQERELRKTFTYDLAKQLEDLTRQEAPNRVTVMALHFNELYNETEIADLAMLVGWNLYFGWYNGEIDDLGKFLDEQHQRYPNRPIMISEYGPGADVRISADPPIKYDYSQAYQLKLHKRYYEQVMERDFVAGMTAWNFADFGSEFRGEAIPHVNQKGLVQYNREPKDIYYWYRVMLNHKEALAHIALTYQDQLTLVDTNTYKVNFFSNQKTGTAYLNGKKLKDLEFNTGVAALDVPFVDGNNTLELKTNGASVEKRLSVIKINNLTDRDISKLAINIGATIHFQDTKTNTQFLRDRAYSKGLYGYVGNLGTDEGDIEKKWIPNNIKNSDLEPVYQNMLIGCERYKVDLPNGNYKVTLYFVEPKLKSDVDLIYNLKSTSDTLEDSVQKRVFDILVNGNLIRSHVNLAKEYPDKYGVTQTTEVDINNNEGLTISLNPIEGKPVISGILIENRNQ